ncbi:MAG: adenylyl-sulfate kinase [Acidobacteria bacterium]|nr:adenylyl-sulfate kinase [Acidobacteriota bacterium]
MSDVPPPVVPASSAARDRHRARALRIAVCGASRHGKSTLIDRLRDRLPPALDGSTFTELADSASGGPFAHEVARRAPAPDAVLIVVDARHGMVDETRRQVLVASLAGVRAAILVVTKVDLAGYAESRFRDVASSGVAFASAVGLPETIAIPVAALDAENVIAAGARMGWWHGPSVAGALDALDRDRIDGRPTPLRLAVEDVAVEPGGCRIAGTLTSGVLRPGDRIRAQPSGRESSVRSIEIGAVSLQEAEAGASVVVRLADEVGVRRGDLLSAAAAPAEVADQFETTIVWMGREPLFAGRRYGLAAGGDPVPMQVTDLKYRFDLETLAHAAARTLAVGDVGVCNVSLDRPMPFDAAREHLGTGGFSIVDPASAAVLGAGFVHFALRRAHNIHAQPTDVDRRARAALKKQQPCVLWFTGLSGAGKSTIANLVEARLHAMGRHTYLLDGDNVRHGLSKDLGFTPADRVENIRRIGEVARLMVDAGLIVLTAFISPFRAERRLARSLLADGEFLEVFVDAPLAVAESRDPKGLYAKARRGELRNFTGIDSPYETPERAELVLKTDELSPEESAGRVIALLRERRRI